jgi:hypothetical protein
MPQLVKLEMQKRQGKRRFYIRFWKLAVTIEFPSPAKAG